MSIASISIVLASIGLLFGLWAFFGRSDGLGPQSDRRILFPFRGRSLSSSALDATLRLARAENATLVPAYLMNVPNTMPLDSALPKQSQVALPILEAIEQKATRAGVPVDMRLERGRNTQHAIRKLIEHEQFARTVVAAESGAGSDGFDPDEVAWLLKNVPGEILVIRPNR